LVDAFPDFLRNSISGENGNVFPSTEEVNAYLEGQEDLTEEAPWAVISRFVSHGPIVPEITAERDRLIGLYGKNEVHEVFSNFIFHEVKLAIKDKDRNALERALENTPAWFGEESEAYALRFRSYYFQMTGMWEDLVRTGEKVARDLNPDEFDLLTDIARTLYLNSPGEGYLKRAATWMEKVISRDEAYPYLEIYALLLSKTGEKERAEILVEEAYQNARKANRDTSQWEMLLEELR
jgi:hypothetical protein